MKHSIDLTPEQESRLRERAARRGCNPEAFLQSLIDRELGKPGGPFAKVEESITRAFAKPEKVNNPGHETSPPAGAEGESLADFLADHIGVVSREHRLALLRRGRGLWKHRTDLPSLEELREESNRHEKWRGL